MAFDLEQFERHTYGRRIAEASNDLFALLERLEEADLGRRVRSA